MDVIVPILFLGSLVGGPILGWWLATKLSYLLIALLGAACAFFVRSQTDKEEGILFGIPVIFFLFGLAFGVFTTGLNWDRVWEVSKPYILR
jgi:Na+/H+ antiporter NhaD/arsenite permease-like protein